MAKEVAVVARPGSDGSEGGEGFTRLHKMNIRAFTGMMVRMERCNEIKIR